MTVESSIPITIVRIPILCVGTNMLENQIYYENKGRFHGIDGHVVCQDSRIPHDIIVFIRKVRRIKQNGNKANQENRIGSRKAFEKP